MFRGSGLPGGHPSPARHINRVIERVIEGAREHDLGLELKDIKVIGGEPTIDGMLADEWLAQMTEA